jgi:hypothetical protein
MALRTVVAGGGGVTGHAIATGRCQNGGVSCFFAPVAAVVLLATQAFAQSPEPELTPPPDAPTSTEPPAPPPLPPAFFERMLTVDEKGRVYEGRQRRLLTREEVLERLERPDLFEKSDAIARKRLTLAISAGLVAVTGAAVGIALIATAPPVATVECESDVQTYNEVCVPRHMAYETAGSVVLVVGIVGASLLATFAWWSNPDPVRRDEATAAVSAYNGKLKRSLAPPPVSWRVAPWLAPGQGGLAALVTW